MFTRSWPKRSERGLFSPPPRGGGGGGGGGRGGGGGGARRRGRRRPPPEMMARFTKGHGLGNDYLVMAEADLDFPLAPAAVRWICHRNWGVGSDGILLRTGSTLAAVGPPLFHPAGREAANAGA